MITAQQIIDRFGMKPLLEEGGYYVETYRCDETICTDALDDRYGSERNISTAILYLLTDDTCSKMHRVKSDEIFHFYSGDPVLMLNIFPDGSDKLITLGSDISAGQLPQIIVPHGTWQGAMIIEPGRFALMGCTVAPGFEFEDFQIADRDRLLGEYPERNRILQKLL